MKMMMVVGCDHYHDDDGDDLVCGIYRQTSQVLQLAVLFFLHSSMCAADHVSVSACVYVCMLLASSSSLLSW